MKKKVLILVATVLAIVCCAILFTWKPVKNEDQAIKIAQSFVSIVSTIFRKDFSEYEIHAELEGDIWTVWYGRPSVYDENGKILSGYLGGGGPELRILKMNGWVILFFFQK